MQILVHLKSGYTYEMGLDTFSGDVSCEDVADSLNSFLSEASSIQFGGPDGSWVVCKTSEVSHIKVIP